MSIFAFCAFLPREFERNRTLSKKTIYRLRKFLGWCIIKLKIRLRIFLYTPVLCLWSSDHRHSCGDASAGTEQGAGAGEDHPVSWAGAGAGPRLTALYRFLQRLLLPGQSGQQFGELPLVDQCHGDAQTDLCSELDHGALGQGRWRHHDVSVAAV